MIRYFLFFVISLIALEACQKSVKAPEISSDQADISEEPSLEEFTKVDDYDAEKAAKEQTIREDKSIDKRKAEEKRIEEKQASSTKTSSSKPTKKPAKPKKKFGVIKFDSTVYRLPPMTEGDKVSLNFGFSNEGEGPLQILTAEATCGCTTPNIPFLDILPGERGNIGVDYNSVNKYGHQEPEIVITTNGKPKKVVLKVSVDILDREKVDSTKVDTLSN